MALSIVFILLLSLLPISELRGAIPYGMQYSSLNPGLVFIIAVAANLLVIPLVFVFLDYFHKHLLAIGLYRRLFDRFVSRTRRKAHSYVEKYGWAGLALFVAIPLPVTGAYTGTLAAWLLGIERRKAYIALATGVIIAGTIVTVVMMTGMKIGLFVNNHLIN